MKHTDKYVCARCFDDSAIKDFIAGNLTSPECSFCGQRNLRKNIAADGNAVIKFILEGIRSEYSTVDDESVPWDNEDHEYAVPTCGIWELVHDKHAEISERPDVLDWIAETIGYDDIWCERDPMVLSQEDGLISGWEDFCEAVKHQTRFLFFRPKPIRAFPEVGDEPYYVYPSDLLEELAATVNRIGLNKTFPAGT